MPGHNFRWQTLIRLLNLKVTRIPDLALEMVPSLIVGDASEVTPHLRAPAAWYGGTIAAVVGEGAAITVAPTDGWGCEVAAVSMSTGSNTLQLQFGIELGAGSLGVLGTLGTANPMHKEAMSTIVRYGTTAAGLPAASPIWRVDVIGICWLDRARLYVPRGYTLGFKSSVVNVSTAISVMVREIPEELGSHAA